MQYPGMKIAMKGITYNTKQLLSVEWLLPTVMVRDLSEE